MTQARPQLKALKRESVGRKVKQLRKQGWLPASVYGKEFASISVQINQKEVEKLFDEVGKAGLVDLVIGEEKALPILFKNPQYDPMIGNLIHIDLHKVNLKEKIVATVPIELVGESPAVKVGNVLIEISNEIEVEALPTDLPEKIEVDISGLVEANTVITVADLKVDTDKVEIKTDLTQVIVKIEEPKEEVIEEVPVEAEVAPGDVPATEQKTPEEGEGGEVAGDEKKKEKGEE